MSGSYDFIGSTDLTREDSSFRRGSRPGKLPSLT